MMSRPFVSTLAMITNLPWNTFRALPSTVWSDLSLKLRQQQQRQVVFRSSHGRNQAGLSVIPRRRLHRRRNAGTTRRVLVRRGSGHTVATCVIIYFAELYVKSPNNAANPRADATR